MYKRMIVSILIASATLAVAISSFGAADRPNRPRVVYSPKKVFSGIKNLEKGTPRDAQILELSLRESERIRVTYSGIQVDPHPKATGRQLAFQRRIADLMIRRDFIPDARLGHVSRNYQGMGNVAGWHGHILGTTPVEGGILVKVNVYPRMTGGMTVLNDCFEEHYFYDGNQLHFVKAVEDDSPKIVTF